MPSTPSQNPDNSSGLLKTLGAVFSGVLFGLFLSKLKSPTQQSVGSVSSNTDSDSETNRGNVLPSVPTQTLPSPPNPGNPCQCCHHRIPRWKIALDVGMFLATVGAFIAAAIYAGITHRMWTEMQQQTCIQREATTNAKRAWIGLSETPKVQVSSLAGKTYSANTELSIKNFGEGPAQNVFFMSQLATHGHVQDAITRSCDMIFLFVGLKPTVPVASNIGDLFFKTQWGKVMFPGESLNSGASEGGNSSDILGQEVFVVGCIVYKDQFGTPHWTKFSYSTGPLVQDVVRDPSSFKHMYVSTANNYTDEVDKKPGCPIIEP